MVVGYAPERDAPVAFDEPGDRAFDRGPVACVVGLESFVPGCGAVVAHQRVLGMEQDLPALGCGGALGPQWATGAAGPERCPSFRGDRTHQPVGARQRRAY